MLIEGIAYGLNEMRFRFFSFLTFLLLVLPLIIAPLLDSQYLAHLPHAELRG
jgi:hypothetical protein